MTPPQPSPHLKQSFLGPSGTDDNKCGNDRKEEKQTPSSDFRAHVQIAHPRVRVINVQKDVI